MKILRSVNRRGFRIEPAGFYSLLKPNTWFPATRLPRPFRYRAGKSAELHDQETKPPNITTLRADYRGTVRQALIVLAAIAMVAGMLWWIMHP